MSDDIRATVDEWYELPEGAIYVRYPALLSAVEKVLALHTPCFPLDGPDKACSHCAVPGEPDERTWVEWPCPTVQTIQEALGGVTND